MGQNGEIMGTIEVHRRHRIAALHAFAWNKDSIAKAEHSKWADEGGDWIDFPGDEPYASAAMPNRIAQAMAENEAPGAAAQYALVELADIPEIRAKLHVGALLTRDLVPVVRALLSHAPMRPVMPSPPPDIAVHGDSPAGREVAAVVARHAPHCSAHIEAYADAMQVMLAKLARSSAEAIRQDALRIATAHGLRLELRATTPDGDVYHRRDGDGAGGAYAVSAGEWDESKP